MKPFTEIYTIVAVSDEESWDICNFESAVMAVNFKEFLLKVISNEENKEKYKEIFEDYCVSPYGDGSIADFFCMVESESNVEFDTDRFYTCVYCGKVAFFNLDGARLCEDCYSTEQ